VNNILGENTSVHFSDALSGLSTLNNEKTSNNNDLELKVVAKEEDKEEDKEKEKATLNEEENKEEEEN
jgi:hypothetical protein